MYDCMSPTKYALKWHKLNSSICNSLRSTSDDGWHFEV